MVSQVRVGDNSLLTIRIYQNQPMDNNVRRKSLRILFSVLLMYGILVGLHEGEFWPFSIYPMFSQGGNNWSRAVVRDVSGESEAIEWEPVSLNSLPGESFALTPNDIDPIDVANYVSKTKDWTESRVAGLTATFSRARASRNLMIYRVDGTIDPADSVIVSFIPYVFISDDSTVVNPILR